MAVVPSGPSALDVDATGPGGTRGRRKPAFLQGLLPDDPSVFVWLRFSHEHASTDGHAKNLALLIEPEGQVRLAPFFDMASMHPHADKVHPRQLRMSMKIGGQFRWHAIREEHWDRLREEMGIG